MEYGSNGANSAFTARIVSFDKARSQELSLLARDCGLPISADDDDFLEENLPQNAIHNECIMVDFPSISERPDNELNKLSSYIGSSNVKAFVWTDLDRLDTAFAIFPPSMCHFLIGASDAEAAMLLTEETRRGAMDQLHDRSRDEGYDELHKLSNELANVARSLSQIVGKEDDADSASPNISYGRDTGQSGSSLADKPVSFRPATAPVILPDGMTQNVSSNGLNAQAIRNVIRLRRLRERFFDADLFADPAWDILLDLMAARLENNPVSVSSLCIAASVPPTTALRWITSMVKNGLLERRQDPNDARRVFLELANDTAGKIEEYFKKASQIDGGVI